MTPLAHLNVKMFQHILISFLYQIIRLLIELCFLHVIEEAECIDDENNNWNEYLQTSYDEMLCESDIE